MIGILVIRPEDTVVAKRHLILCDPVVSERVALAFSNKRCHERRMGNVDLKPLVLGVSSARTPALVAEDRAITRLAR